MTQRVVAGASIVVFGLLAVMVHLLVGMHDESFPVALDSPSRIQLDFAQAAVEGDEAINALRSWDADAGIGLVKQSADLDGNLRGKVLIPLNDRHSLPKTVGWYDDEPPARVVGPEALAHTTPTGMYFVTGDSARLPSFVAMLAQQGVQVTRDDASVWSGLQGLYRMKSLFIAFVTGCVLLATLVLYWLAVKSRSRALRVLGGTSVSRIQTHDLGQLLLLVAGVWLAVSAVATVLIGLWRGWIYAPLFAAYLGALGGLMLAVVIAVALLMSTVSVPSPDLIARRQPATLGVRRAAGAVKGVTFVLVLLTVGPAWGALSQAVGTAEQLSRWERLANQVTVGFPGTSEEDFQRLMPAFGSLVREAEDDGSMALSHVYADTPNDEHSWVSKSLGERWSSFAFVNQRWLDLVVAKGDRTRLVDVPREQVPQPFLDELALSLDGWKRSDEPAERVLAGFGYLRPAGGPIPLVSGGDLAHLDDVLVILVPGAWTTFNDDSLISMASGSTLLFTGLDKTQMLLESHGLARDIKVQRAAEAGILAAQFAAYEAWLSVVSMVGLAVALVVAAGISAYIMALLAARNDFARRLAGRPWLRVLERRVALEVALAVLLAAAVAALRPPDQVLPVLVAATLVVLLSPAAHVLAARRGFADVGARRL
jgi:hypothetical protein